MGSHRNVMCGVQRVKHSHSPCFGYVLFDFFGCPPAHSLRLLRGACLAADEFTAEGQGEDAKLHVLVDAGQFADLHAVAGFLEHLAGAPFLGCLCQFQDSAWGYPAAVVVAFDDELRVRLRGSRSRSRSRSGGGPVAAAYSPRSAGVRLSRYGGAHSTSVLRAGGSERPDRSDRIPRQPSYYVHTMAQCGHGTKGGGSRSASWPMTVRLCVLSQLRDAGTSTTH